MKIEDRFDSDGKNIQRVTFDAPLFQPWEPEDDMMAPITDDLLAEWATGKGYISSRDGHILVRELLAARSQLDRIANELEKLAGR